MSSFTYEFENKKTSLERYEWDNVWWERNDLTDRDRILYIGDSISCATRRFATMESNESILFDGVGTSKSIDNPYFESLIKSFAMQQGKRKAIIFNNGLHGWHLDDTTGYREHYEKMVKFLLSEFKGTPIFIALTTAVEDRERNDRVIIRNKVAQSVAKEYSLKVIDLYSITNEHRDLLSSDGVHLVEEGYVLLAKEIVEKVKSI